MFMDEKRDRTLKDEDAKKKAAKAKKRAEARRRAEEKRRYFEYYDDVKHDRNKEW